MTSLGIARDNQARGLSYCRSCDHEYDDSQVLKIPDVDGSGVEEVCPMCEEEDERILYYCRQDIDEPLHSPDECRRFHREP